VYVSAVTESFRCPISRPISAQERPCACRSEILRCRRSCGENTGMPDALHALAIAVRRRSAEAPGKSGASRSRSSRGGRVASIEFGSRGAVCVDYGHHEFVIGVEEIIPSVVGHLEKARHWID
jgi:hypothetical protein